MQKTQKISDTTLLKDLFEQDQHLSVRVNCFAELVSRHGNILCLTILLVNKKLNPYETIDIGKMEGVIFDAFDRVEVNKYIDMQSLCNGNEFMWRSYLTALSAFATFDLLQHNNKNKCNRFSVIEFVKNFENYLLLDSEEESNVEYQLPIHAKSCDYCSLICCLCFEVIESTIVKQSSPAEQDFTKSPVWRDQIASLSQHHAKNIHSKFPTRFEKFIIQHRKFLIAATLAVVTTGTLSLAIAGAVRLNERVGNSLSVSQPALSIEQIDKQLSQPTRYEKLDSAINLYLQFLSVHDPSKAAEYLSQSETIADEMANLTGERWGQDLVSYYRTVQPTNIAKLINARSIRHEIENTPTGDGYSKNIKLIDQSLLNFTEAGASVEIIRTEIQKLKFSVKTGNHKTAEELTTKNLSRSLQAKYLFLYAQYLSWNGNRLSDNADYENALINLNQAIQISDNLEIPKFAFGPICVKTAIYHVQDRNDLAYQSALEGLSQAGNLKNHHTITLLQMAGISAHIIGSADKQAEALSYLNKALQYSMDLDLPAYSALTLSMSGLVLAEDGKSIEAEMQMQQAMSSLNNIIEQQPREFAESIITGYFAKQQGIAGNVEKSIELYKKAISMSKALNHKQYSMMAQLHEGLGQQLSKNGNSTEAKKEQDMAVAIRKEANKPNELFNSFLSFAVIKR